MGLFSGVFKKNPSSLCIAILASQPKPIIKRIKSSNRSVMPLPIEAPAVSPTTISGPSSMEKIRIYRAICELTKLTIKRIMPAATAKVLPADMVGIKKAREKVTRRINKRGKTN